jgi:hypothetical protein
MNIPVGLKGPAHIAELVPPVAALAGVGTASVFAFLHLYDQSADPASAEAAQVTSPAVAELTWDVVGAVAALAVLILAWGLAADIRRGLYR